MSFILLVVRPITLNGTFEDSLLKVKLGLILWDQSVYLKKTLQLIWVITVFIPNKSMSILSGIKFGIMKHNSDKCIITLPRKQDTLKDYDSKFLLELVWDCFIALNVLRVLNSQITNNKSQCKLLARRFCLSWSGLLSITSWTKVVNYFLINYLKKVESCSSMQRDSVWNILCKQYIIILSQFHHEQFQPPNTKIEIFSFLVHYAD